MSLPPEGTHLAEGIKDVVEEDQYLALGHLRNVVHALAGIVADPCILIAEACEDRRDDLLQVPSNILQPLSGGPSQRRVGAKLQRRRWRNTDWTEGNRGRGQAYEATVPGMGLVHGVCVLMTELIDDLADLLVLFVGKSLSHDSLQACFGSASQLSMV